VKSFHTISIPFALLHIVMLRLAKSYFAGPANHCYNVIIAKLDLNPPGEAAAGFACPGARLAQLMLGCRGGR